MAVINLYSLGHFLQWFFIGRFLLKNWYVFLVLSAGWEVFELLLPYDIARESALNKSGDMLLNCLGFAAGNALKTK